jgi:THO complex subunit 2
MLLFFEPSMLLELGLVNQMFEKKIVRMNTNLLYKQKRFNLLREESEGYSKLIVEVYTLAYANNNLANRVQTTANSIEAFIGYFDLDPIRSLDIFLDIAAVNLVSNCEFFVEVLKLSPWWPSVPATDITSLQDISKGGNSMAAQLLGFKLSAYDQEPVQENLMMLIAVLIKEGFISLADIYEFLIPSDEDVENYEETWKQDMVKESYLANASALALAAPLTDDDDSKQARLKQKDDKKDEANEENKQRDPKLLNQKALLLKSLLSVGSIYPSLFILIKFPFICGPFPELADLINRLVDFTIQPLYEKTRSFECCSEIQIARKLPSSTTKDTVLVDPYPEAIKQTLSPLEVHSEAGVEYSFFYENWSNELTQISIENDEESLKQLQQVSENLLKFSGPLLSRDSSLVAKICRIGVYYCKQQPDEFLEFWSEFFRLYLLPCISLLDANPGILFEIYSLLSKLSFDTRYAMYGEWQQVLLKSNPHLKLASSKAEKNTKDVLKRLSKTNVREMMRKLAKVSYTNPITTFNVFISQVESYDNLADLVVEAARYFTDMGWDALPYAIMTQLSSGRGTYQSSGLHDQKWILCR